jgi:hypothetical protein
MSWELKRKLVYAVAAIIGVSAVSIFLLRDTLFPAPTCFDKKQNGFEAGVDCGGGCFLRCSQEVSPLTVLWAKTVRGGKGVYDLVAMVNNNNIDNSSLETGYTFTMYDEQGNVSGYFSGSTTAPLGGKFPIIIQNIPLKKSPTNVLLSLSDGLHYTVKESPSSPTIKIVTRRYEAGQTPRVYATVMNTKRVEINNLPVRVLLFDEKDNVYAVGQTVIPFLGKEEVKEIIITWNESLPVFPTRIGIYPIFNPFDAIGY